MPLLGRRRLALPSPQHPHYNAPGAALWSTAKVFVLKELLNIPRVNGHRYMGCVGRGGECLVAAQMQDARQSPTSCKRGYHHTKPAHANTTPIPATAHPETGSKAAGRNKQGCDSTASTECDFFNKKSLSVDAEKTSPGSFGHISLDRPI